MKKKDIEKMIVYLNKKFPNQMIKVRDWNIIESLISQRNNYLIETFMVGIKIASRHPLFNGNKRLGFLVSFSNKKINKDDVLLWFDLFDKE